MTAQDILNVLRKMFQRFRGTPWFRVTYLVLLGLIVAQLYTLTQSPVACIAILLMPVSVFVVPYWLGERKMRRFAENAAPVFAIAILVAAATFTQSLLAQPDPLELRSFPTFQSTPTMVLSNGTVQPYHAPPDTNFTFRVKLTTSVNGAPGDYLVYLNLTVVRGLNAFERPSFAMAFDAANSTSNNTLNGTWFAKRMTLGDSIYGYGFSVRDQGTNWTVSGADFGPLTASGWTYYGFFTYATAFSMTLPVIFYFLILFMWWYTRRSRQARTRMLGKLPEASASKDEPTDKPKAEIEFGSKASKAAAFTCTNCGADVRESDAKCPKCGAVFED